MAIHTIKDDAYTINFKNKAHKDFYSECLQKCRYYINSEELDAKNNQEVGKIRDA